MYLITLSQYMEFFNSPVRELLLGTLFGKEKTFTFIIPYKVPTAMQY